MIYFIQCNGSKRIKIGHTTSLIGRMQSIMGCNAYPVEILAVAEGGRRLERAYHDDLLQWRIHGEWFEPSRRVMERVAEARNGILLDEASKETATKGWLEKKTNLANERRQIAAAVNGVQVPELYGDES